MNIKKGLIIILVVILVLLLLVLGILVIGSNLFSIKVLNEEALNAPYLGEEYEYPEVECTFLGLSANAELTKKVDLNTMGEQEAEYTCTKFIFRKVKTITINVKDVEKPKIELNGNSETAVYVGRTYTEKGAKATDNLDGDLTDKIQISGSVDGNTIGTYEIKYSVSDKAGNEAVEIRTVKVTEKPSDSSCGEKGVVYLTFDDGPYDETTTKILDVLKQYDVKATFFVTNSGSDELIKREYDEGHAVALHTASHDYAKIYASSEAFWEDLNSVHDRVKRITGQNATLTRFPGGASNTVSRKYHRGIMTQLAQEVEGKGFNFVDWNLDSGDAGQLKSPTFDGKVQEEIRNVTSALSKTRGNVILMHDIKQTTANAIEEIVKFGKDNGYIFKVLDESVICRQKINN